jgi:hypothetical protein
MGVAGDSGPGGGMDARSHVHADAAVTMSDVHVDVHADATRDATRDSSDPQVSDSGAVAVTVTFKDVTTDAGIGHQQSMTWTCNAISCDIEAPRMTGGAAAGDFDGDGHVDLFVTRFGMSDILYRNQGDGTFLNVSDAAGFTAALGSNGAGYCDIDNDGDVDLYVTMLGENRHYLYVNDGTGSFSEEAVARGTGLMPEVLHQGTSVAFGDFDLDGWPDIHVDEWRGAWLGITDPGNTRLMKNRGASEAGVFDDVTVQAGVAIDMPFGVFAFSSSFTDLDDDGFPDLVIAGDFETSHLFWNGGDGTFSEGTIAAGVGTDENGMGSTVGDFDGDGRLDWFVTAIFDPAAACSSPPCPWKGSGNRLYRNIGGRMFEDNTDVAGVRDGGWGWGTAFFDYDNDGDLDLVMTDGVIFTANNDLEAAFRSNPMRLWRNDGGTFTEVAIASGLTDTDNGKGLLVLDFDEDGDLDIFAVNNGDTPRLYRNDGGNSNGWLRVRLRGTRSTRDALGTKVWVRRTPDAAPMLREVRYGSNFLSQDEPVLHFGLGASEEAVAELRVRWPTGLEQTFTGLDRNQTIEIAEPAGDQ